MYIMCMCIVLIKLIFEESYRVHYLCTVLFYSCKKLADSKETEFVSPSPLNMNPNVISQEPQIGNQFFDRTQENVVLQMTTNKCIESSCPRVNTMEEHIDKMYLDILKKKISVAPTLLPQDDKLNKVSVYDLNRFDILINYVILILSVLFLKLMQLIRH